MSDRDDEDEPKSRAEMVIGELKTDAVNNATDDGARLARFILRAEFRVDAAIDKARRDSAEQRRRVAALTTPGTDDDMPF